MFAQPRANHFDAAAQFGRLGDRSEAHLGVAGGFVGALIQGFKRAAFSNEAGVGSAAIAHSAVKTSEPITEGFVSLLEPLIDTVIICTGVRANTDLAREAGMLVGRGVLVNDQMRSSALGVYAVGECAEHRGVVYGLVGPGLEQADKLDSLMNEIRQERESRGGSPEDSDASDGTDPDSGQEGSEKPSPSEG